MAKGLLCGNWLHALDPKPIDVVQQLGFIKDKHCLRQFLPFVEITKFHGAHAANPFDE
jgi:hypothetical protein